MATNGNGISTTQVLRVVGGLFLLGLTGMLGALWKDSLQQSRDITILQTWQGSVDRELPALRALDKNASQSTYQLGEMYAALKDMVVALKAQQAQLDTLQVNQRMQDLKLQATLDRIETQVRKR